MHTRSSASRAQQLEPGAVTARGPGVCPPEWDRDCQCQCTSLTVPLTRVLLGPSLSCVTHSGWPSGLKRRPPGVRASDSGPGTL
eukprot:155205-Rhodomonas_salina.2